MRSSASAAAEPEAQSLSGVLGGAWALGGPGPGAVQTQGSTDAQGAFERPTLDVPKALA
jgi:hypothetical protein